MSASMALLNTGVLQDSETPQVKSMSIGQNFKVLYYSKYESTKLRYYEKTR